MIPFDLGAVLKRGLARDRRPPDRLLHCSSDLIGSLRHSMLSIAGAPRVESEVVSDIRMRTGTMWHSYFNDLMKAEGLTVIPEVKLNEWMPTGWGGTADWVIWNPERRAFALADLKTTKGEGLRWIERDGIKLEHRWQLSAYYWALVSANYPMVRGFSVLYLPMNDTADKDEVVEPLLLEGEPIAKDEVIAVMQIRAALVTEYLNSGPWPVCNLNVGMTNSEHPAEEWYDDFLTDELAPPMERVQKLVKNYKTGALELKLVPHWSAQFCPFPVELCDCSTQGTTKIGEWKEGEKGAFADYYPRSGYEDIVPLLAP